MSDWFKPINPAAGLLGFSKKPTAPVLAAPTRVVEAKKRTIEDVFARTKPKQQQIRAKHGETVPHTMRGRVLVMLCALCEGKTANTVSDGALIVAAWKQWPEVYGLGNLPYPDAAKVRAKLCGPEGLIGRGMVVRLYEGVYQLTSEGAAWWKAVGKAWYASEANKRELTSDVTPDVTTLGSGRD